jgi:hypothetical protein
MSRGVRNALTSIVAALLLAACQPTGWAEDGPAPANQFIRVTNVSLSAWRIYVDGDYYVGRIQPGESRCFRVHYRHQHVVHLRAHAVGGGLRYTPEFNIASFPNWSWELSESHSSDFGSLIPFEGKCQ